MKIYPLLTILVLARSDSSFLSKFYDQNEITLNKDGVFDSLTLGDFKTINSPVSFIDCGGDEGTVTMVDIDPNPLIIGKSVTLKITGTTKSAFTVTKLRATAYISEIPISTYDLSLHQSCPKGSCSFTQSVNVPNIVPPGSYEIEVKGQNEKSNNLICGKATLELKKENIVTLDENVNFKDCGGSKATITSVNIQPYPPTIGNQVTITAKGTATEPFALNRIKSTIYVGGIPLSSSTALSNITCPTKSCIMRQNIIVPSLVPPGTYDIQIQGQYKKNLNLVCFKMTVDLLEMIRDPISFTNCGGELAEVKAVDITPYPPIIGKEVSLTVTGNAKESFNIEKLVAVVYTQGIPIATQTIPLHAQCPSQGACSLTHTLKVPSIVPEGAYQVEVKAQNSQTQNAICGKSTIELKKPSKKYENSIDFKDCGGDQGTITSVEVTPYPPNIGQDVKIVVEGKTKSAFIITKLKATAFVAGIPLSSENVPIQVNCPSGTCSITKTLKVPNSVPPGTYMVEIQAQNNEDNNLVCVKGHVEIK